MSKLFENLNRRQFLRMVAAGTCGAACHNVLRPFGNVAYAVGNGPPGPVKNFVEIFMYGGCCSQGMSPAFNTGALGRYPTLYRTPAQAAAIPGNSSIGLHLGFAPMVTEANRDKSSVALVVGCGHPSRYSRSHDVAQQTNERLAYDSNLPSGIGVGAQLAAQIGDQLGLISFGGGSEFSYGGNIPPRSVSNLAAAKIQFYLHEGYELTADMVRASNNPATAAQQAVEDANDSLDTLLPTLQSLNGLTPPGNFPNTGMGRNLKDVARMVMGQVGSVFYVPYGGFDTHSNEAAQHTTLFTELGNALAALVISLKAIPGRVAPRAWDETVILFRTDFGRTWENNAQGTDHGHAYNQIILGGRVIGGVKGDVPTAPQYQNAPQDYMGSTFVQFNAMQPTKEVAQAMGLNVSSWPSFPGNVFTPIGIVS